MRNACINNMKQLVLSLHNYHDVYKKLPVIAGRCDNLFEQRIGQGSGADLDCRMAQYSWIVRILPYIEEGSLYNELAVDSDKFRIAPFDPSLRTDTNSDPANRHFSQFSIATLLCPTFPDDRYSHEGPPAEAYASVLPKVDRLTGQPLGVALTNYIAVSATHKERLRPEGNEGGGPNGAIVSGKALTFDDVKDGLACTIVLSETKESSNSSWYDSSGTWTVALLPQQVLPPDRNPIDFRIDQKEVLRTGLNVGPTKKSPDGYGAGLPEHIRRRWGPSSDHNGGDIVIHAFADGSVRVIRADIDPLVYAALVTRNGGENLSQNDILK
jgi:hypothetical protein